MWHYAGHLLTALQLDCSAGRDTMCMEGFWECFSGLYCHSRQHEGSWGGSDTLSGRLGSGPYIPHKACPGRELAPPGTRCREGSGEVPFRCPTYDAKGDKKTKQYYTKLCNVLHSITQALRYNREKRHLNVVDIQSNEDQIKCYNLKRIGDFEELGTQCNWWPIQFVYAF